MPAGASHPRLFGGIGRRTRESPAERFPASPKGPRRPQPQAPSAWLICAAHKPITYAVKSQKVDWHLGIRFQFLPQSNHVGIYRTGIGNRLIAPDRVQQDVASEWAIF